jgi:hypothetical protein
MAGMGYLLPVVAAELLRRPADAAGRLPDVAGFLRAPGRERSPVEVEPVAAGEAAEDAVNAGSDAGSAAELVSVEDFDAAERPSSTHAATAPNSNTNGMT